MSWPAFTGTQYTETRATHPPRRPEWRRVLVGGVLVAVICWYFGVDAWHSILLGCAITVTALACLLGMSAADAREVSWHLVQRASRRGSRSDLVGLSAALRGGWGYVGLSAEGRLQQIARQRLDLEGLDLRNPQHRAAIEQLIGTTAYRALAPGRRNRVIRLHRLVHCLDMLAAIAFAHYPVPAARPRLNLRRPRER